MLGSGITEPPGKLALARPQMLSPFYRDCNCLGAGSIYYWGYFALGPILRKASVASLAAAQCPERSS